MKKQALFTLICAFFLVSGCAGERGATQPARTTGAGYYKVGTPYKIKGNWYHPKEDYSYDETGIASWYGQDFHNKTTANGEIFNKNELTAAHQTLPMPSLARVTNLENGRAIVVRINDRGPYSGKRIIDLSQRGAQLLGFERQGTAKVRVQVLSDESRAIAEAMRTYGGAPSAQKTAYEPEPVQTPVEPEGRSYAPVFEPLPEPSPVVAAPTFEPLAPAAPAPTIETVKPVAEYVQLPVTAQNKIYIQAGAFTKKSNATRLQAKLAPLGTVSVKEAVVKGTLFYRVRVGPLDTVAKADAMLDRVLGAGADNARIVIDE